MPRWGMAIDLDKCVGCQACSMACRAENNVPFAGPDEARLGRPIFWHKVTTEVEGEYPHVRAQFVPQPCMHCDDPPCVEVCPVGATYATDEGVVVVDYDVCIGCRYCATACPYGARAFNWYEPRWPAPYNQYLNPDVPLRPKGVVEKCTFCSHRLQRAKQDAAAQERELTDPDLVLLPACNQICPAKARYFGDLEDPQSTVSRLARNPRAFRLLEDLGTEPMVYYLAEEKS